MKEYKAAVRIQSWFRGCLVRAFYANLHANAIIIQASFRGHLGRIEYRRRLEVCGGRGGIKGIERERRYGVEKRVKQFALLFFCIAEMFGRHENRILQRNGN